LMVVFSLPFYVYLIFLLVARVNANIKINKDFVIYFFVVFIILANSFLKGNSLSLIVLDTFIVLLPFFFYILLYKTSFDINSYKKDFFKFLLISSIIVSLGIKLQFSYFTLLAIVYIIFFAKPNSNGVFLIVLL